MTGRILDAAGYNIPGGGLEYVDLPDVAILDGIILLQM
jgi:hypothetical protein